MISSAHGSNADPSTQNAIQILKDLIAYPTVSSTSNVDINHHVASMLSDIGFDVATTEYKDETGVSKANLVAVRNPVAAGESRSDGLAYFCHTDVVPAEHWIGADPQQHSNPFQAVEKDGRIYGRGACDMKGSLATMIAAASRVDVRNQTRPLWIVCTADEEVGFGGAKHLSQHCEAFRDLVRHDPVSIIGEPTELGVVHAHKGITGFTLQARGRAGHSATDFGINANEAMVPVLQKLLEICERTRLDKTLRDERFDPPTLSWNFGFSDHASAINITPERSDAWVSFRSMPDVNGRDLIDEVDAVARQHNVKLRILNGCDPMWTSPESEHVRSMEQLAGKKSRTVSYATDGGILDELGCRIVIGPGSIAQAHTVDEWISIDQLRDGISLYERAIEHWACSGNL